MAASGPDLAAPALRALRGVATDADADAEKGALPLASSASDPDSASSSESSSSRSAASSACRACSFSASSTIGSGTWLAGVRSAAAGEAGERISGEASDSGVKAAEGRGLVGVSGPDPDPDLDLGAGDPSSSPSAMNPSCRSGAAPLSFSASIFFRAAIIASRTLGFFAPPAGAAGDLVGVAEPVAARGAPEDARRPPAREVDATGDRAATSSTGRVGIPPGAGRALSSNFLPPASSPVASFAARSGQTGSSSQNARRAVSLTCGFASASPLRTAASRASVPPLASSAARAVLAYTRKSVTTCCAPNCRAEAVFSPRRATTSCTVRRWYGACSRRVVTVACEPEATIFFVWPAMERQCARKPSRRWSTAGEGDRDEASSAMRARADSATVVRSEEACIVWNVVRVRPAEPGRKQFSATHRLDDPLLDPLDIPHKRLLERPRRHRTEQHAPNARDAAIPRSPVVLRLAALEARVHRGELGVEVPFGGEVDGRELDGGDRGRRSRSRGVFGRIRGRCGAIRSVAVSVGARLRPSGRRCRCRRAVAQHLAKNLVLDAPANVEAKHFLLEIRARSIGHGGVGKDGDGRLEGEGADAGIRVGQERQEEGREGFQGREGGGRLVCCGGRWRTSEGGEDGEALFARASVLARKGVLAKPGLQDTPRRVGGVRRRGTEGSAGCGDDSLGSELAGEGFRVCESVPGQAEVEGVGEGVRMSGRPGAAVVPEGLEGGEGGVRDAGVVALQGRLQTRCEQFDVRHSLAVVSSVL